MLKIIKLMMCCFKQLKHDSHFKFYQTQNEVPKVLSVFKVKLLSIEMQI